MVAPPVPDMSNGKGRTKFNPGSSRLGAGREANDHTPEKNYSYETKEEAKTQPIVAPLKKNKYTFIIVDSKQASR